MSTPTPVGDVVAITSGGPVADILAVIAAARRRVIVCSVEDADAIRAALPGHPVQSADSCLPGTAYLMDPPDYFANSTVTQDGALT